jgi:hypothetical protein
LPHLGPFTKQSHWAAAPRFQSRLHDSELAPFGPVNSDDVLHMALGWYGTYFYESEMALISEWMEQCGTKVLDNAGIVREAIFHQLGGELSAAVPTTGRLREMKSIWSFVTVHLPLSFFTV